MLNLAAGSPISSNSVRTLLSCPDLVHVVANDLVQGASTIVLDRRKQLQHLVVRERYDKPAIISGCIDASLNEEITAIELATQQNASLASIWAKAPCELIKL